MSVKSTDRAHMATVYGLLEETSDCERCGREAHLVVGIGQINPDGSAEDREIHTCLACCLDLIVLLKTKSRLSAA